MFEMGIKCFWAILQGVKCWWCWRGSCLGKVDSLKGYVRRLKKRHLVLLKRDERAERGNHQIGLFRPTINYDGRNAVLYFP